MHRIPRWGWFAILASLIVLQGFSLVMRLLG